MENDEAIRFRIAVKAFIIDKEKLFIIQRSEKDIQSPGIWEIPGGRLELGEDPTVGLTREIKEETGLNINVLTPLNIRHFKRKDGQIITMIIFLCTLKEDSSVKLSEEHVGHEWIDIANCEDKLTDFFHKEARIFKNIYSNSKNWLSSIS